MPVFETQKFITGSSEHSEEVNGAGEALLETVRKLIRSLKDKRGQLSLESGEPPEQPHGF
jgi:hypothetical protein